MDELLPVDVVAPRPQRRREWSAGTLPEPPDMAAGTGDDERVGSTAAHFSALSLNPKLQSSYLGEGGDGGRWWRRKEGKRGPLGEGGTHAEAI